MNDTEGACVTYLERICAYRVWGKNMRDRKHLKDLGIGEKIILNCTLKKSIGRSLTGSIWFTIAACSCDDGNEQTSTNGNSNMKINKLSGRKNTYS